MIIENGLLSQSKHYNSCQWCAHPYCSVLIVLRLQLGFAPTPSCLLHELQFDHINCILLTQILHGMLLLREESMEKLKHLYWSFYLPIVTFYSVAVKVTPSSAHYIAPLPSPSLLRHSPSLVLSRSTLSLHRRADAAPAAASSPLQLFVLVHDRKSGVKKTQNREGEVPLHVNNAPVLTKIQWISQSILSGNEIRASAQTWVAAAWHLSLSSSEEPLTCQRTSTSGHGVSEDKEQVLDADRQKQTLECTRTWTAFARPPLEVDQEVVELVVVTEGNMKYQKYITVMQMAMGVTASNKDCLPTKRQLW